MNAELTRLVDNLNLPVVEIDPNRRYWLVRTSEGDYFEEFFLDNFIAINWNEFNSFDKFADSSKDNTKKELEAVYKDKQPGRIFGQINRFLFEMNIGDVVMIPSKSSKYIRFGVIASEPYIRDINETDLEEGECPYLKARDVSWIKVVKRADLDPYLFKMMQSHQTVNNANEYAHVIDRTLHSFFIKNQTAYLVLPVQKQGDIPASDLVNFVSSIVDLVPEVRNLEGIDKDFSKEDLDLKLNVQSPGFTEFSSHIPELIFGLGFIIVCLSGTKFRPTFLKEEESEINIKGVLEDKIKEKTRDLDSIEKRHLEVFEKVKADLPEELKNLLENRED